MLCFEVFLGAHFLQSGHRPVELKAQPGSVVKRFWRLSSGGNQLDITVVKFIHQIDKPPRRVLLVSTQPRNLLYQHGVVLASHFDIIDYVEMAREYHTVLVEQIPRLGRDKEDAARRFINLVDEFYDRNVKLIATAAQPPETLYDGSRLRFEFDRTVSRLQEMRTQEYLKAEHRP